MGDVSIAAVCQSFRIEPFTESSALLDDPEALRREASEEGYLFFRGLVEPERLLALRRAVLGLCDKHGWLAPGAPLMNGLAREGIRLGAYDDKRWIAFLCEVLPLPAFRELGLHPRILRVLEAMYGEPAVPHQGDLCRVVAPATPEFTTLPHQDHYYLRGSDRVWTAWLPLGDCPVELGGLAVLPRSHRDGLLAHAGAGSGTRGVEITGDRTWAMSDLNAGDVVLSSCLTVHRAGDNLTDRLRISVDYRYQPASAAILPEEPKAPFSARRGSRLFHRTECAWVGRIAEGEWVALASASEAKEFGLVECPACQPRQ